MEHSVKKIYNILFVSLPEKLLVVLILVMTLSAFTQVIARYFLKIPLSWTEELARYLFIWNTFIGAGVGYRYKRHILIDLFTNRFVGVAEYIYKTAMHLLVTIMGFIMVIKGYELALLAGNTTSPVLPISMKYIYLAVPVGGILFIVYSIEGLVELVKSKKSNPVVESSAHSA